MTSRQQRMVSCKRSDIGPTQEIISTISTDFGLLTRCHVRIQWSIQLGQNDVSLWGDFFGRLWLDTDFHWLQFIFGYVAVTRAYCSHACSSHSGETLHWKVLSIKRSPTDIVKRLRLVLYHIQQLWENWAITISKIRTRLSACSLQNRRSLELQRWK